MEPGSCLVPHHRTRPGTPHPLLDRPAPTRVRLYSGTRRDIWTGPGALGGECSVNGHLPVHEIGSQLRQTIPSALGQPIRDRHIPFLHVTSLVQALAYRGRAASPDKKPNKTPPSHLITSSAR